MLYAVDTEFMEDGSRIELLSIGLVAEDGREFYQQVVDAPVSHANAFVREHVIPHLTTCPRGDKDWHWTKKHLQWRNFTCHPGCPWRWPSEIKKNLITFGGESPIFVGYYSAYDWVALCQLFGTMMDLPKGWPMYAHDLRALLDQTGRQDVTQPDDMPHHALSDARWIMQTWKQFYPGNTR